MLAKKLLCLQTKHWEYDILWRNVLPAMIASEVIEKLSLILGMA
jgi:hypothetical protein